MSKFKVGDNVYIYSDDLFGVVSNVLEDQDTPYPVWIRNKDGHFIGKFTEDGRLYLVNKNPDLFTIDEAIKKGFITKEQFEEHRPKKKVKYRHVLYTNEWRELAVSNQKYKSLKEFKKQVSYTEVISFLKYGTEWREE